MLPADAKPWTLVIVNARPSMIPVQHIRSTCDRTRSIRSATTSGWVWYARTFGGLGRFLSEPLRTWPAPAAVVRGHRRPPRRPVVVTVSARVSAYDENSAGRPSTARSSHRFADGCVITNH